MCGSQSGVFRRSLANRSHVIEVFIELVFREILVYRQAAAGEVLSDESIYICYDRPASLSDNVESNDF